MTDHEDTSPRSDHDSPWKEALEGWFPEFLALLFPTVHAGIDWSRGHRFLDKEFQQIVRDAETRKTWKFRLIRLMYDRGYGRKTILELFRVIDWMIRLPAALEAAFRQDIYAFEESKQMPYLTTVERAGIEKGLQQGIEQGIEQGMEKGKQIGYREGEADLLLWLIEKKFGVESADAARQRVESADVDRLRIWSERTLNADSVEAIFR